MAQKQKPQQKSPIHQVLGGFGLIAGATYPFRALATFKKTPNLLNYVLVPIFVNVVVGIALYVGLLFPGLNRIDTWMALVSSRLDTLIANLPAWLSFLSVIDNALAWVMRVLLVGLLSIATGFVLVQFGVILGSPWYGQLSEQLELLRIGKLPAAEPPNVMTISRDIWRALMFEVKKLLLAGGLGLLLLGLNAVPGIGTVVASVGGVAIAATIVCLDFLDAPLERRRLRFRSKLGIIARSLPASASFALVCLALISIPLVNLLAVPLCVTSGTLFFCDRVWPQLHK